MLKKSLILGTLLVSTTFGAGLPETASDASLDLAGIQKMTWELSPLRVAHTPESKAHAIEEFTNAAAALRSNPMMAKSEPTIISGLGNILLHLGKKDAAKDLYKFVLTLDKNVFGYSMAHTCLSLHNLGETDLAISTLRGLIGDASLNGTVREDAIRSFYLINTELHRSEAREMWASLLVREGKVATIEDARNAASKQFLTDEEAKAAKAKAKRSQVEAAPREVEAESDTNDMPPLEVA